MRGPSYTGRILGGRYAVGELLGEGGWGSVYAGVQTDLGRKVALKILHVDVAIAAEAVSRFEREAKAAAALGHPNIAQVTDFVAGGSRSGTMEPPFLVMELLTGATLGAVLRRRSVLPPARVASIAFQMLAALDTAHRAGIVHRDVKPDNVFLVSMPGIEDFVKLLDFGIAKLSSENAAQITGDGQMLGSPAFMSPEQVRSIDVDPRTDLYAVGATMYFALAGRLPFDATNVAVLLAAIMDRPPTPLAVVAPGIDPRLAALVERALDKDPNRRFATAADMRAALEPWVVASGGVTPVVLRASAHPAMQRTGPPTPPVMASPISPLGYTAPPMTGGPPPGAPTPMTMPSPIGPPSNGGQGFTPIAAPPRGGGGSNAFVIAIVAVVALLLVAGVVAAGAVYFVGQRGGEAAKAIATASVAVSASPSSPPIATSIATPAATTSVVSKGGPRVTPGPSPSPSPPGPAPLPVVDAGGGKLATVDAGAKKEWGGAVPSYSGGSFGPYDIEKSRAELDRVMPRIAPCYAATQYDPPDHQFTDWTLTIDPSGNVTSVRRTTDYEPHPKLDACVIAGLRTMKWQALPGGGSPHVSLRARTRDNP